LDKIRTLENPFVICPYVFEKAEMTFNYVESVISILEKTGL